jgi:hypothetical protein
MFDLNFSQLLLNKDFGQWIDLCQGSKHLIEERGPNGFPEQFERELLESQQGFIVSLTKKMVLASLSAEITDAAKIDSLVDT